MVSTRSLSQSVTRAQRRNIPAPLREELVSLETCELLRAIRKRKRRQYLKALARRRLEASRSSYGYELQGNQYYTRYYYPENFTDEEEESGAED